MTAGVGGATHPGTALFVRPARAACQTTAGSGVGVIQTYRHGSPAHQGRGERLQRGAPGSRVTELTRQLVEFGAIHPALPLKCHANNNQPVREGCCLHGRGRLPPRLASLSLSHTSNLLEMTNGPLPIQFPAHPAPSLDRVRDNRPLRKR